jgi:hypothetical protein
MYTWGHNEILQMALESSNFTPEQLKAIKLGLRYPDFPCGLYMFQDGRLVLTKSLCSLIQTFKDVTNNFASSYASHNGYYSVWHSMTYSPERSVAKITRDIIDQVISFLWLCFVDENTEESRPEPEYFWLGMALHIIMDSYSPAHTLRCSAGASADCKDLIKAVKAHRAKLTATMRKNNAVLKDLKDDLLKIARTIGQDDEQHVEQVLNYIYQKHHIKSQGKKSELAKIAMFMLFHNHHQLAIKKITDAPVRQRRRQATAAIVTYYSYPQQNIWFHKVHDTIFMLHQMKLYDDVVSDCSTILKMTQQVDPSKLSSVKQYLKKVHAFCVTKIFALAPEVENIGTGVSRAFYSRF